MKDNALHSSSVTRIMKKPLIKGFKIIIKAYGVYVEVFSPIENNPSGTMQGYLDDSLKYELVPYFQGKVYIPSIYRRKSSTNLVALDPFIDSDQYLYIESNKSLKIHSLVVCRLPSKKILNFRIHSHSEVGNDSGRIIQRYEIAPVVSTEPILNIEELKEGAVEELNKEPRKESFNQQDNNYDNSKYKYSPL